MQRRDKFQTNQHLCKAISGHKVEPKRLHQTPIDADQAAAKGAEPDH